MKSSWVTSLVIGLTVATVLAALTLVAPNLIESWESKTFDLRAQWHRATPDSGRLLLIGRDAESDARFGVGIWDRAVFATMISGLHRAGAQVVALDFHFGEMTPEVRGGSSSDRALIEAATRAGNVLFPLPEFLVDHAGVASTRTIPLRNELARFVPTFEPGVLERLPRGEHIVGPLPGLLRAARGVGHIGAMSDADGVYRRIPSFVNADGQAIPSMGVALAAAYLRVSAEQITLSQGHSLTFQGATFPDGHTRNISIPVDEQGDILVKYAGRWEEGPFPYLPLVDVWDAIQEGREEELREQVAGKAVLILHAALGSDKRQTPLELKAPGGFILANLFNTVVNEDALRSSPAWLKWGLVLVTGVWASWCLLGLSLAMGFVAVMATGVAYVVAAVGGFVFGGIVMPIVVPLMALVGASGLTLGWTRWASAERIRELEDERLSLHRELAGRQERLVERETRVERLEEDLEQARAEALSGGTQTAQLRDVLESLQRDLKVAQSKATESRQAVRQLESRLESIQAAELHRSPVAQGELQTLAEECARFGILTRDPTMLRCWKDLKKAAGTSTPILILGEAGTGKELFAQAVHRLSARSARPFVPVNMAAVPPDLFESQLFGHLRGSFTGAVHDHQGHFIQADKGTIFLDEIGDLRPDLQAKLLRVLQEGVVTRLGDRNAVAVDVRVVAATNRDLLRGIAEGWFREDLYYRLHGIELQLPPLRERHDDIAELAMAFVEEATAKSGRSRMVLSQGAMERLEGWPWKGNVRELKRCLENVVILAEGHTILEQDLRLTGTAVLSPRDTPEVPSALPSEADGDPRKSDQALLRVLRDHSFDLQATGTTLGWDRSTVMQRLKGMCFQAMVETKGDQRAAASTLAGQPGLTRLVEVKLKEYVEHLKKVVATYASAEAALVGCRKRFKNLPERYQEALATLIRLQSDERE